MTAIRTTQVAVEVLRLPAAPNLRTTQVAVEVLSLTPPPAAPRTLIQMLTVT